MPNEVTYPVRVLRAHVTELEAALAVCLAEPAARAVHRLRTGTRRVEAQLLLLALLPGLPEHRRETARLGRELRRLRRAAGEVRDLDVHRKHLETLLAPPRAEPTPEGDESAVLPREGKREQPEGGAATSEPESGSPAPETSPAPKIPPAPKALPATKALPAPETAPAPPEAPAALGGSILGLRDHLGKRREKAAHTLAKLLTHRQGKAALAAESLLAALRGAGSLRLGAAELVAHATTVLQRDNLLAHPGPDKLDAEELHTVRKSAKAARYLAETLPGNPLAEAAARQFEAVQEAGGQWHDAVEITRAARKYLGRHQPLAAAFAAERKGLLRAYRLALHGLDARHGQPEKPARKPGQPRASKSDARQAREAATAQTPPPRARTSKASGASVGSETSKTSKTSKVSKTAQAAPAPRSAKPPAPPQPAKAGPTPRPARSSGRSPAPTPRPPSRRGTPANKEAAPRPGTA